MVRKVTVAHDGVGDRQRADGVVSKSARREEKREVRFFRLETFISRSDDVTSNSAYHAAFMCFLIWKITANVISPVLRLADTREVLSHRRRHGLLVGVKMRENLWPLNVPTFME